MPIKKDKINGLYFEDQGTGLTVVLLHGFMESVFMWESLSERLSKRFRVLCVDLPGHGRSDDLENDFSIDHMALIVRHLLL